MATQIPKMEWTGDLSENLTLFKQKMTLFFEDEDITDTVKQSRKICRGIGDEGLKRLNVSGLTDEQKKDPKELWAFFNGQLRVGVNFRIHRLHLMQLRQKPGENLDDFVTRARTLATKCEFAPDELNERIVELVIASTPFDAFRNDLYSKAKGHPLAEVLAEGRKYEAATAGNNQLHKLGMATTDDKTEDTPVHGIRGRDRKCGNCGRNHKPRQCPAYNDICDACGRKGHWAALCRKTAKSRQGDQPSNATKPRRAKPKRKTQQRKRVDYLEEDYDSETDDDHTGVQKHFYSITISNKCFDSITDDRDEAFTVLHVQPPLLKGHSHTLRLKIDTGASGNTLPLRTFRQMYGDSPEQLKLLRSAKHVNLTAYGGSKIPCLGYLVINTRFSDSGWIPSIFYVVDVPGPAIVGLRTSTDLKLVTIHATDCIPTDSIQTCKAITDVEQLKAAYPDQFDRIGNFSGKAQLHLKTDAQPFIDPPRKVSIHMREKLKTEIDSMIEQGVLRKVEEHTDWCSSLTYSTKKDGSLRICIDPQKLNNSLKRCPHKIPTLEELNPQFANAKYFSKLDAKAGYWSVHLDEKSQLLTTCRTPFGRVCWTRLPFGLCVSQDIFQARMDQILEGLPGVVGIADDVAVFGATAEEHDANLRGLMNRAAKTGLVFNSSKCAIKKRCISFFGNLYTDAGIKPDPEKVCDIHNMPSPQSKDDLQRFMGMLTYLSQYIPKFAEKAHTLRNLMKADTPWTWDQSYEKCYQDLKSLITTDCNLAYYDARKTLHLEVDASQKGLGVALVQDGKPVAFGSKTLTSCQSRYSNIEREMLAIVYGVQRYHTYLYGKFFVVITDHKPLVTICQKPLHSAPPRLQRMLLKVQGYSFDVIYRPGSQMILADTLSRLPNPENNTDIDLDEQVDATDVTTAMINFSEQKQTKLREETIKDPTLCAVRDLVYNGWPEHIKDLPNPARPYWSFRDELAIEAGVLFKGRQVLIPESMKHDILQQLHDSHQGVEKTRRLARESVYWVGINADIEQLCKSCQLCQEFQDANPRGNITPHEIPSKPWQLIASDLFEVAGKNYLLTVDRYSKYPLLDEMGSSVTSLAVMRKIRDYCALFGKPEEIMTDNGPQYTGPSFKEFVSSWDIKHVTSSPHYPRSNGFIERHVRHIKSVVKKCLLQKSDIALALLQLRATPVDTKLPSPAELLFGHPIVTNLPSRSAPGLAVHRQQLESRAEDMCIQHKPCRQKLPDLSPGQNVRILDKEKKSWRPGTVVRKDDNPDSYIVSTPNGSQLRRTRSHLRDSTPTPPKLNFDVASNPVCDSGPPKGTTADPPLRRSTRTIKKPSRYRDSN